MDFSKSRSLVHCFVCGKLSPYRDVPGVRFCCTSACFHLMMLVEDVLINMDSPLLKNYLRLYFDFKKFERDLAEGFGRGFEW